MKELEHYLKSLLLRDVNFILDGRVIKSGQVLLVNVKDYYLFFTLKVGNTSKIWEIPRPFCFHLLGNQLLFDYNLESLHKDDLSLKIKITSYKMPKQSKFINNTLKIEIQNGPKEIFS